MVLPHIAAMAKKKGIDILSASDFTHPLWFREIKGQLKEAAEGLYRLKSGKWEASRALGTSSEGRNSSSRLTSKLTSHVSSQPLFLLSTEISSIYSQGGKVRRIHNLVFVPTFDVVEKLNNELLKRGCNLSSDGRPIIGLSSKNLLELVLSIDNKAFLIPCHAWTPWFSLYGSNSGFDSISECFEELSKEIFGIETGLSSDPEMNWRIKELDNRSILSFSDAHSPMKMGREATVFELEKPSFENIRRAIVGEKWVVSQEVRASLTSHPHILYTIEFYPEEGKYHYTGHRNCNVLQSPQETKEKGVICPVCKRTLTIGVMQRVQELARGISNDKFQISNDEYGVRWIEDGRGIHPKFVKLVPLIEILAESMEGLTSSPKVINKFEQMIGDFGSEINILLKTETSDIEKLHGPKIAEGLGKVRRGDIVIRPGFDGEYGKVAIWNGEKSDVSEVKETEESQLGLF